MSIFNHLKANESRPFLFSSESVTEGHPDKICDQISDAVLDSLLQQDPSSRVACEVVASVGGIFVTGEISSSGWVKIPVLVRNILKKIGYTKSEMGINCDNCVVTIAINRQSLDISQGIEEKENREQGAGDQGLMFGYACNETPELMPLPITLAHRITKMLADKRKDGTLPWLRPDGKSQITIKYVGLQPVSISSIVVSAQHSPNVDNEEIRREITEKIILPVCSSYLTKETKYLINKTGRFVTGGPQGDVGLTGRKIIVDTYGGMGRHGGGCFSGKDPSKVDRSATYMARHIAKNIIAAKLATHCEVQLAYCIGVAEPVSVSINAFGTSIVPEEKIEQIVKKLFPLKPAQIIRYLDLKKPIYRKTATYGHFGRQDVEFSWEKTNMVNELKKELCLKSCTQTPPILS
jgi:S-adenosylmethionine synthetase